MSTYVIILKYLLLKILFKLRQKYKDEKNDVLQMLVKLIMNSFYCERVGKEIEKSFSCKSETWMMSECD